MPPVRILAGAAAAVALLCGCTSGSSGSSGSTYDIKADDQSCQVRPTTVSAGDVSFRVENTGSQVTEVYVYAKQGATFSDVVGEVEDVGPGTTQDLSVTLDPGRYEVACKPGMTGDGIRAALHVTSGQRG